MDEQERNVRCVLAKNGRRSHAPHGGLSTMPDEPQTKLLKTKQSLGEEVGAKAARQAQARGHSAQGVWFGLGMMG